jgi:hypothetical protein
MVECIRYETDRSGIVTKTKCPYSGEIFPIDVGSDSCKACPHFVRDDAKHKMVICEHEEL